MRVRGFFFLSTVLGALFGAQVARNNSGILFVWFIEMQPFIGLAGMRDSFSRVYEISPRPRTESPE